MSSEDIRWVQRFQNFSKSCMLLSEINNYAPEETIAIIREGFIQRFEIAFELAWKTLRDYLEYEGLNVQPTPRAVIKEAFATGIVSDGETFISMLEARNMMSHKYDENTFNAVFLQIQREFLPLLNNLCIFFEDKKV